ncbi:hypothetical protein ABFA07_013258 [Porites harrisoni]
MGDEAMSTHVLVEHRKAENELEELQLTKSHKSKQRPSRTKAPTPTPTQPKEFTWKRTSRLTWSSRLLSPFRRTSRFLPRA